MNLHHLENLYPEQPHWKSSCEKLQKAVTMPELVASALRIGLLFARLSVEQELKNRAEIPTIWPSCPNCQGSIRSKGFRPRQMETLIGSIH
jgi:hypothetical protein